MNPSALTITASNPATTYGQSSPTITPTYSPLKHGDTKTATAATCTSTFSSTQNAGTTYTNSCSGAADGNYTITYATSTGTVTKVTPTIAVAAPAPAPVLGTSGTFTVTVTGVSAGSPSGTVTFAVTGPAGTSPSCAAQTLTAGSGGTATASCTLSSMRAGTYSVTASYGGNTNYNAAGPSAAATTTVVKRSPTVTVAAPAPPAWGGQATFTATVNGVTGVVPTGSVTWQISGPTAVSCGSSTIVAATAATATATCTVTGLHAGTYSVQASYGGDANYLAAGPSAAADVLVPHKVTTTSLTSSANPTTYKAPVTLTATVNNGYQTSGSVSFFDGTTPIGTANLDATGKAVLVTSFGVGAHDLTATYSGDTENASSTSAALPETVNTAPLTITALPATGPYGTIPAVTPSYSGFVNGETSAALTEPATCSANTTITTAPPVARASALDRLPMAVVGRDMRDSYVVGWDI